MNYNYIVLIFYLIVFHNDKIYSYNKLTVKNRKMNILTQFRLLSSYVSPENDPEYNEVKKNQVVRSGYIPPELDPEYRNIVIKSARTFEKRAINEKTLIQSDNEYSSFPVPKEGDIVLYKGKWGDKTIGRIRFLQYVSKYETFFADIVPLKEGKSENVYILDRESTAEYLSVEELSPVKFYFVRSENGYKIYRNKLNPKDTVLKAPNYRKVDSSYNPRSKVVPYPFQSICYKYYHYRQ